MLTPGVAVEAMQYSHVKCPWCGEKMTRAKQEGIWSPWMCWTAACYTRQHEWSIASKTRNKKGAERIQWLYVPVPKQVEFLERARALRRWWLAQDTSVVESLLGPDAVTARPATRILYGGQAGASKSHGLRHALFRECMTHKDMNCLILRRTFKQLKDTHLRQMEREQHALGARYLSSDKEMLFPATGSLIVAGHCETDADAAQYLSTDYDRIVFDELVTFEVEGALEIMSRARTPMTKETIYDDGGAQVWAGTNPGGRHSLWVKNFFVDKEVDPDRYPAYIPQLYDFVSANLDDNPYLDPGYRLSLMQLSDVRRRQLLEGDWDAFDGQFFDFLKTRDGAPWHVQDLGLVA